MSIPMNVRRFVFVGVSLMMVCALYAGSAGWTSAAPAPGGVEGPSFSLTLPSAEDLAVLPSGASGLAAEINGQKMLWNVVDGGIALSLGGPIGGGPVVYGFCTYAVTSALFAIGSAGLAAAALSGGLVVAGIFLTAEFLQAAAVAAGSFSALYGLVAAFVC